ncbi:hypothetical protein ACMFMG_002115 [Clarireedia jacksonii]
MAIPIDNLGLDTLLKERVYIKWVDDQGEPFSLGSCLPRNKQKTNLLMQVVCDSEGRIHVHFSLKITYKAVGKSRQMELLLVVPPHGDFEYAWKSRPIVQISDLCHADASAIHEAGISNSEQLHVLSFDLRFLGFVAKQAKISKIPCNDNDVPRSLAHTLRLLSLVKTFQVYIRPSDYAQQSLSSIRQRLSGTGAEISISDMIEMYSRQGIELVDWTKFGLQEPPDTVPSPVVLPSPDARGLPDVLAPPGILPPPYVTNDGSRSTRVQVPQSPPDANININLAPNINEAIVLATPGSLPVHHGIFSPDSEKPSEVAKDLDLDDVYQDSGHVENLELDSDEERLAELNAQQLSQQLRQDETSNALRLELRDWLDAAMTINGDVYKHRGLSQKLSILGTSVRKSDVELFNATRPWCSALFLFNPTDSSRQASKEADGSFVSDMANLIKWVNTFHRGAEMTKLKDEFLQLGSVARACDMEQYRRHKRDIILCILVNPDLGRVDRENSKVLSGKRKFSEIGSIGCG